MKELEFRVTNRCNLRCLHCYSESSPDNSYSFPVEKAQSVMEKYAVLLELLGVSEKEPVVLSITGGEPLLYGIDNLKKIVETSRLCIEKRFSKYLHVGMASNILMMNKSAVDFIKDFNIAVIASYDPVIRFLDPQIESQWHSKYEYLKDKGLLLPVGITITRYVMSFNLRSLVEKHGIKEVYFQPIMPVGRALEHPELFISKDEISSYIIRMFEELPDVKFLPYSEIPVQYRSLKETGVGSIDCWNDCYNSFSIDYNGNVGTPGECVPLYGNIFNDPPEAILFNKNRLHYIQSKSCACRCLSCKYISFCRGGCLTLSRLPGTECNGLKRILDYLIKE